MELTYSELRQKEVINICDGKRLGRISDLVFTYPQNRLTGIVVPGCGRIGIFRSAPELFISMSCITKIGEDVILVNLASSSGTGINTSACSQGMSQGSLYTSQNTQNIQNRTDSDME